MSRFVLQNTFIKIHIFQVLIMFYNIKSQSYVLEIVDVLNASSLSTEGVQAQNELSKPIPLSPL
jgi:hypothetical protein